MADELAQLRRRRDRRDPRSLAISATSTTVRRESDMGVLDGQVAIVTGAGQGVGRGIALAIAAEGAEVALLGRTVSKCVAVAAEIADRGGRAVAIECDVEHRDQIEASVQQVDRRVRSARSARQQRPHQGVQLDQEADRRRHGDDVAVGPVGHVPVHAGLLPVPPREHRAASSTSARVRGSSPTARCRGMR